jgi:hypothetical protein
MKARLVVIQEATAFLQSKENLGSGDNLTSLQSESEAYMSERAGRFSDERAAHLLARAALGPVVLEWSKELVRERLKEAARGIERIVGRVGPSSDTGFWPEVALFADATAADRNIIYQAELDGTRAPARLTGAGGDRDVSRMEAAIYWPAFYLKEDRFNEQRWALKIWGECEATKTSFSEYFRVLGCSKRTAYRRVNEALLVILDGLIRDGVEP